MASFSLTFTQAYVQTNRILGVNKIINSYSKTKMPIFTMQPNIKIQLEKDRNQILQQSCIVHTSIHAIICMLKLTRLN